MIRIAVCDDEVIFAEKVKKIVDKYCTKRQIPFQIDLYQSGKEFIADHVKMMEYHIVFLISIWRK